MEEKMKVLPWMFAEKLEETMKVLPWMLQQKTKVVPWMFEAMMEGTLGRILVWGRAMKTILGVITVQLPWCIRSRRRLRGGGCAN